VLRAGAANLLRLAPPTGISGSVVDEAGTPVMIYWIAVESFRPTGAPADGSDGGAAPPRKIALTVNDQDGAFSWSVLAPGRYDLVVSAPQRPFVRAGGIEVAPGAVTKGVRIVAAPGAIVVGTVTSAKTHEPITGAIVFTELGVELGLTAVPAVSNNGEYRLEGASPAGFDLHVIHVGHEEHITRGLRAPANGEPLRVDVALRRLGDGPPPLRQ